MTTVLPDLVEEDPTLLRRRALAVAAVAKRLEALPGWEWHPDELDDAAVAAVDALWPLLSALYVARVA